MQQAPIRDLYHLCEVDPEAREGFMNYKCKGHKNKEGEIYKQYHDIVTGPTTVNLCQCSEQCPNYYKCGMRRPTNERTHLEACMREHHDLQITVQKGKTGTVPYSALQTPPRLVPGAPGTLPGTIHNPIPIYVSFLVCVCVCVWCGARFHRSPKWGNFLESNAQWYKAARPLRPKHTQPNPVQQG
jgi:hypothetical protein